VGVHFGNVSSRVLGQNLCDVNIISFQVSSHIEDADKINLTVIRMLEQAIEGYQVFRKEQCLIIWILGLTSKKQFQNL
jgi:hypothetical protein